MDTGIRETKNSERHLKRLMKDYIRYYLIERVLPMSLLSHES